MKRGTVGQRYDVKEEVGRGGMQSVWRAHDRRLDRDVAIKTPLGSSAVKRFAQSAQLSARVRHPNVASALDYFVEADAAYFVEELIHGVNLDDCFEQNFPRLCPDSVAKTLHHLAKGVAASHEAGVIHRDLKPSNIMVSGDLSFQMVKITDFGIAKLAEQQIDADLREWRKSSAMSSTLLGAIPFMAPEAVTKTDIWPGRPMDVWALGAIAYWMLTGKHPFGAGIPAVFGIMKGAPPPPPQASIMKGATHELASNLWAAILDCMQKEPAARPTASALADRCAAMRYLNWPRVTATITGKDPKTSVWFGDTDDGEIALPRDEFIQGSPAMHRRVSCFAFDGKPKPRGVAVIQLKDDD